MRRLVKAYEPSRDCCEVSALKMVLTREETSSCVGGTPEGVLDTATGISGDSGCGILCVSLCVCVCVYNEGAFQRGVAGIDQT